jgi:hypothetical protein
MWASTSSKHEEAVMRSCRIRIARGFGVVLGLAVG